ncbi:unnamed protein product [Arctia plantaginis]|uniref:C2H2-type domain-containing protein n=1 Tax=Arctia plantaginis TaxID=874455 RepID=A0A8S1BH81_ARCPL|nr:unnamed protein product [Arctia plantaginis]
MDCEDSINLYLIPKALFCICCLEQTGPYVKLGACSHREYLDSFPIPVISSVPETVCYSCHGTLKKIAQFRQQVQQSFNLLEKKIESLENITSSKRNLTISKTRLLNTPELKKHVKEEPENKSDSVTKMKNNRTALEILNNNTNSLSSLTSYQNFIGLTESLLEVTSNHFNLSLISTPLPPESNIEKKNSGPYGTPVLPDEIKQEPEMEIVSDPISLAVNIDVNSKESRIKKENEIDIVDETLERISHNHEDNNEDPYTMKDLTYDSVVFPEYTYKNREIQNVSEKSNLSINNKHIENNNSKTSVLPKESKMECDDVTYGKIMLPDGIKDHPEKLDDSLTTIENCLGEIWQKEYNTRSPESSSIVNDGYSQRKSRSSLCLIPIKLSKKELEAERQEKLNSSEFRLMEYRCRHCITGFLFKENLNDHIKRKHARKDPKTHVTCEICRQVVLCKDAREHKLRHYNRLECKICKKRFVLFDEAYDHYSSAHTPLNNKKNINRQLESYIRSKRLQAKKKSVNKSITGTTIEGGKTDGTESLPESSCSK